MQFALQLIHFLFIFFEAILGFVSLRVLARYQISRFHYKQFETSNRKDLEWLYNLDEAANVNKKNINEGGNFQDLKKD